MMALIAAAAMVIATIPAFVRLFAGPTLYDRALATRAIMTRAAITCAALAVVSAQAAWVDAALALLFAALVVMTGVLKVFGARTFQAALAREEA